MLILILRKDKKVQTSLIKIYTNYYPIVSMEKVSNLLEKELM